ncbi:hypothetical protein PMIN02_012209 [Paraphaeosphaeria minitans]
MRTLHDILVPDKYACWFCMRTDHPWCHLHTNPVDVETRGSALYESSVLWVSADVALPPSMGMAKIEELDCVLSPILMRFRPEADEMAATRSRGRSTSIDFA